MKKKKEVETFRTKSELEDYVNNLSDKLNSIINYHLTEGNLDIPEVLTVISDISLDLYHRHTGEKL